MATLRTNEVIVRSLDLDLRLSQDELDTLWLVLRRVSGNSSGRKGLCGDMERAIVAYVTDEIRESDTVGEHDDVQPFVLEDGRSWNRNTIHFGAEITR